MWNTLNAPTQLNRMEKEAEVTAEQKQLAEFIKATHNNLRRESEIYGADEAWRRHVARSDVLEVRRPDVNNETCLLILSPCYLLI